MPSPPATVPSPASSSSADHTSDTAGNPRSRRSRVSAEHTLNRVRENQRRHRARQRDHVTSLEKKLAETEALLTEARAEIALLKEAAAAAAVQATASDSSQIQGTTRYDRNDSTTMSTMMAENGNSMLIRDMIPTAQSSNPQQGTLALVQPQHASSLPSDYPDGSVMHQALPDLSFLGEASSSYFLPTGTSTSTSTSTTTGTPSHTNNANYFINLPLVPYPALPSPSNNTATTNSNNSGPPPCCSDPPSSPPPGDEPVDLECSSCKTRPPPSPSESTTLCAQAYVMISQQNFRNLDPDTIRLWLAQGLRRAQREGEGCRVENGALLRLLDFISGL
ncbi:hypothetical protein DDE82_001287 [Stemphylium lycopersici]|nr:hypothetical protein DDE82_001287 [Stemphylium lycopersici]